jgi:pimeloyl-ACP methyl ester carboxylesterase
MHFVHLKGRGPNPRPLILTHGWPWTFHDWQEVACRLADPEAFGGRADDAFDVVVPSLPGFAFSSPLATTGVDPQRIATLWLRLMRDVLGYQRFGAAGGDWGAMVTGEMALAHADHLSRHLPHAARAAGPGWPLLHTRPVRAGRGVDAGAP